MSDALLDKVSARIGLHVALAKAEEHAIGWRNALMDALRTDVETALALARREGMVAGLQHAGWDATPASPILARTYPLPSRTRQVLREEPVPGTGHPLFRVHEGMLQVLDGSYRECYPTGRQFALMAHALDLYDNPTRTEQVSADESDPWGEGARPVLPNDGHECCTVPGCTHHTVSGLDRAESGWSYVDVLGWRCPVHGTQGHGVGGPGVSTDRDYGGK